LAKAAHKNGRENGIRIHKFPVPETGGLAN
jgi:hypothetical protein